MKLILILIFPTLIFAQNMDHLSVETVERMARENTINPELAEKIKYKIVKNKTSRTPASINTEFNFNSNDSSQIDLIKSDLLKIFPQAN